MQLCPEKGQEPVSGTLAFLRYGGHYMSALFGLGVYRQIYPNLIVS